MNPQFVNPYVKSNKNDDVDIADPDMDLHHADCSTLQAYEVRLQSRPDSLFGAAEAALPGGFYYSIVGRSQCGIHLYSEPFTVEEQRLLLFVL